MTTEEHMNYLSQFGTGPSRPEISSNISLSRERAGFAPNTKIKEHSYKAEFPNIPFTTKPWQTWVSIQLWNCIEIMN